MARVVSHREEFMRQAKQNIVDVVNHTAETVLADARASMKGASRGGANPSKPGTPPNVDTGDLRRRLGVDHATLAQSPVFTARIGTNLVYARALEFGGPGGRITAKGAALTVPLNAKARKLRRRVSSLRKVKTLQYVPYKKGQTTGLLKDSKTGELMFALRKSIHFPARPFLRPALKRAQPQFEKLLSGQLKLTKGFNPR